MSKVKPVLMLDVGNVLVTVDIESIYNAVKDYGFVSNKENGISFIHAIDNLFNLGIMDMDACIDLYFRGIKKTIGKLSYIENKIKLVEHWCSNKCVVLNKEIVDYCFKLLQSDKVNLMLASNMGVDHHRYIRTIHPFFTDEKLLKLHSFEVGAVKPKYLFFKAASDMISNIDTYYASPADIAVRKILYIDDKKENLLGAQKYITEFQHYRGFRTFQFDSAKHKPQLFIDTVQEFLCQNSLSI